MSANVGWADELELEGVAPDIQEDLLHLFHQKFLEEQAEAQRLADTMVRELREARAIDGVGALKRRIPAAAYHLWGQDLGTYDCWGDKGFLHYFDRQAPEARVTCGGTKIQVGYESGNRRRVKSYGP